MTLTAPKARCPRCGADPDDGTLLEIAAARKRLIMENLDDEPGCLGAGVGVTQPEHLPTKEHIRELAQEAFDQIMEQAQVFASAWALVGGKFDSGNAMSDAEDAKAELRTMVRSLADYAAETVRPARPAWVPVSERLPEKFVEVLICFKGAALPATGQYTGNLRDSADGWSYPSENGGDDTDWTVTHWQPLPDHPEAERFAAKSQCAA